jgi:hypothetical protein
MPVMGALPVMEAQQVLETPEERPVLEGVGELLDLLLLGGQAPVIPPVLRVTPAVQHMLVAA